MTQNSWPLSQKSGNTEPHPGTHKNVEERIIATVLSSDLHTYMKGQSFSLLDTHHAHSEWQQLQNNYRDYLLARHCDLDVWN